MSFDRACFWLERMWRYRNITKNLDDYLVRRFGEIVEVRSLEKRKLYTLIVGKDFIRLEFIVSLSKIGEFLSELKALNYYFEGALAPFIWKLHECTKNGDCVSGRPGVVRGLYHTLTTERGMLVGIDFVVKGDAFEKHYSEVTPLNFPFRGVYSLDRFGKDDKKDSGAIWRVLSSLKRFLRRGG